MSIGGSDRSSIIPQELTADALSAILAAYALLSGATFTGNISAPNLTGTNTGDQDLSAFQRFTYFT
jgi:hypothetical protein